MNRWVAGAIVVGVLVPASGSMPQRRPVSSYEVAASSAAAKSKTSTKKPRKKRLKIVADPIRAVVPKPLQEMPAKIEQRIRATSPNPNVQAPVAQAMPPQAPTMPRGPKPETEPLPSGADKFFNAAAKIMTKSWNGNIFVWLPAISTDPNTGPTVGLMPVLVLADSVSHHIRHLLAPSYTYNDLFGQTGTMRYYFYPTDASQLYAAASASQHTNREFKVRYENPALKDGVFYLRSEVYYSADGSERFFGLGPHSRESDESGYVSKDSSFRMAFGANFLNSWRASVGARFRRYATEQNIIPDTQDSATRFPGTPGLGTNNTVTTEARILWDSRDSPITPSRGESGEFFFEKTSLALGSDADYIRYGAEGKHFFLWPNHPRQVTVVHGLYEWVNGPFIPFYELSSLGGRDTLRGFGDRRFVDRGAVVVSVEHRYTFSSLNLMGIQTNFEVAPFMDLGTVFPTLEDAESRNLRPVFGGAFRAAVKPNVVGDVEVGYGKEGTAVFVDINYPF